MKLRIRFCARRAGGTAMLVLGLAVGVSAQERGAAPARVVAVGDVHGAYAEFVAILQRVGLIDSGRQWIGGSSVLVQTGDVPDRGPQTRVVLDRLMELEVEAPKQSGKLIPLLGNHEVMDMMGDVRYVSAEDYQSFANEQSEKVRQQAYQDYMKFLEARGQRSRPDDEAARQGWMAEHPPGFFELRDAYGPQGQYGRWLRQHDAIAQVGDVLFMHGGLNPKLHFRSIDELNRRIRSDLSSFDSLWQSLAERKIIWRYMTLSEAGRRLQEEMQSGSRSPEVENMLRLLDSRTGLLLSPDSPFWYRGYALEPEEKLTRDLDKILARLKVHYIVAAHTVRPKFDITAHFNGRVFLIDTGMLKSFFGGRASALEIENGRFTAYYADAEKPVLLAPEAAALPAASPGGGEGQP